MTKALVIDDELDICLMITKHLRKMQFDVDYALTVKEARQKVRGSPYALMLIDLNLTDGTGIEVIDYINELNLDSKIIVISAYDSEASKVLKRGASFFIPKPFTFKKVDEALKSLNLLPS
ncbi:MAG TPA: response regulator [Cyclobacteriaceae bacterium]